MKNIYLELEYDGTNFYGWQIQNRPSVVKAKYRKLKTVQHTLEKAIKKLFHKKIGIVYSGRTDKRVHAKCQVVNFKTETHIPEESIKQALNTFLPDCIYVKKVKFVDLDFHARFRAKSKVYRYIILNRKEKDTFLRNYSWWIPDKLKISPMKRASCYLLGKKDFSSLAQKASKYEHCRRRIKKISIKKDRDFVYIDIEADGFLRGMARNIVSLLIDVGRRKYDPSTIREIIKGKNRSLFGKPAPARGLYLWKVRY